MDWSAVGKVRGGRSVRGKIIGSGHVTGCAASILSAVGADHATDAANLFPSDTDDPCLCGVVYPDTLGGVFRYHGL
jgi:hypothetical protein